jgi:carbon monoxide dehydrogenase subunit G
LNISGEITVAAPREAVFKTLSDAPTFASCIEGVRDLKAIDATHYSAVLRVYITDIRLWPAFNAIYGKWIGSSRPARSVVPVPEPHFGFKIEIEAVAPEGAS